MTTAAKAQLNGIDVNALTTTIGHIQENPGLARFTFRAHTDWQGGAHSRTSIQSFYGAGREDDSRSEPHLLDGDEPNVLLGTNRGPNAVETMLHALASCLAVGFIYNAAAQGVEVTSLEFDLEGDLDLHSFLGLSQEVRPGFDGIRVRYRVESDAPRERLVELCEYVQNTSPVLDIITNPVPVSISLES